MRIKFLVADRFRNDFSGLFICFCLFTCLFLFFSGCQQGSNKPAPQLAFYHWKTNYNPSEFEKNFLDTLKVQRMYTKFFDVTWSETYGAIPVAEINWKQRSTIEVIPTIFITNQVFQHLQSEEDLDSLAQRILRKINELAPGDSFAEIQIDCDWSQSTKESYFSFLKSLQNQTSDQLSISSTIRLHQLRYPDITGVPPVDRGMLMFYNMGNLNDWLEPNSILNLSTASPYLDAPPYPLALDLALPIFRWGVLYRDGQMTRLINLLSRDDLSDHDRFRQLDENRFELIQSGYIGAYYAYKGDQIRLESVQAEELFAAVQLINTKRAEHWRYVSFYHLDSTLVHDISTNILSSVLEKL